MCITILTTGTQRRIAPKRQPSTSPHWTMQLRITARRQRSAFLIKLIIAIFIPAVYFPHEMMWKG